MKEDDLENIPEFRDVFLEDEVKFGTCFLSTTHSCTFKYHISWCSDNTVSMIICCKTPCEDLNPSDISVCGKIPLESCISSVYYICKTSWICWLISKDCKKALDESHFTNFSL